MTVTDASGPDPQRVNLTTSPRNIEALLSVLPQIEGGGYRIVPVFPSGRRSSVPDARVRQIVATVRDHGGNLTASARQLNDDRVALPSGARPPRKKWTAQQVKQVLESKTGRRILDEPVDLAAAARRSTAQSV